MMSRTITSYGFSVAIQSPSVPVSATSTAKPSASSPRRTAPATFFSSSTIEHAHTTVLVWFSSHLRTSHLKCA